MTEDRHYCLPVDLDGFLYMFDEVMQSGLQIRFFNKPVQDDYLWDIKVFWVHVDVETSKGFDTALECIDDCLEYVENYDK